MGLFNLVRKFITGVFGCLLLVATVKTYSNGQDWEFLGFITVVLLIMAAD